MAHISVDIQNAYKTYFGKNYVIPEEYKEDVGWHTYDYRAYYDGQNPEYYGGYIDIYKGRWVMLPVRLITASKDIFIPCVTIQATRKNTIIRTAVSEREGTVKEQFAVGDWQFNLKGVLIGEAGLFPDKEVQNLREISANMESIELFNGLSDILMPGINKVVVESLEFPETQGKSIRHRPFTMVLESDFVDTLIYERS